MESATTAAIIAATASILTCLLGAKVGKARIFSPYQKEYLERQVFEFLAPIDKLLTFGTAKDWATIRSGVMSLIEENYALTPPLVLSECFPLLSYEKISEEQFIKLRTVVSSIYNWTRREIGHSYDRSKIKKEFAPTNETVEKVELFYFAFVIFVTFFSGILLWLSFVPDEKLEQAKTGVVIILVLVILYLCWVLLIRMFRK